MKFLNHSLISVLIVSLGAMEAMAQSYNFTDLGVNNVAFAISPTKYIAGTIVGAGPQAFYVTYTSTGSIGTVTQVPLMSSDYVYGHGFGVNELTIGGTLHAS